MTRVLTDYDVTKNLSMHEAISCMREFFMSSANGSVISPPRFMVATSHGNMIFTAGAETSVQNVIGFRVYCKHPMYKNTNRPQHVTVFCNRTGDLKGIVLGPVIGAMRTAAIGGVAADVISTQIIEKMAVIGAGFQAKFQIDAILAVRDVSVINFFSRTMDRAKQLANETSKKYNINVMVTKNAKMAVCDADIVLCATNSSTPVLSLEWLKPDCYVASMGPKFKGDAELPSGIANIAKIISTDAIQQITEYGSTFFMNDVSSITTLEHLIYDLTKVPKKGIRVFLSEGRAGSEVFLANALLNKFA